MADQVTGRLGEDEIVLNNAATEATLQRLLQAVERTNRISEGDSESRREELRRLGEESIRSSRRIDNLGSASQRSANIISRGFSALGDSVSGLISEFATGSVRMSDFSSHVTGLINAIPLVGSLVGGPLQLFVSVVDNNIDTFRQLSQTGTDFGSSVFSAQIAASKSGLALQTFAEVVGKNNQSLALMSGGATSGARAFQEISRQVQNNFRKQLAGLGLTMEETAEFQADYLDIQTRLGKAQQRSNSYLANQTSEYVKELGKLSKVTGQQREQISQQLQEQSADKRLKGVLATMSDAGEQTANSVIAAVESQSPEMAEAFKNMIATGGVPLTDFGRDLARDFPEVVRSIRGLRNETASAEEVFATLRQSGRRANNLNDVQIRQASLLASLGSSVKAATLDFMSMSNFAADYNEISQKQQERLNQGANALLTFESSVVQLRNIIIGQLVESELFTDFHDAFKDLIDYITDNDGALKTIKSGITSFSNYITGLIDKVKDSSNDFHITDMITTVLSDAFEKLSPLFVKFFEVALGSLGKAIKNLFAENPVISGAVALGIGSLFALPSVVSALTAGLTGLLTGSTAMAGIRAALSSFGGLLRAGIPGILGTGMTMLGDQQIKNGNPELGQGMKTAGYAGMGMSIGAMIGSPLFGIGALPAAGIGGILGASYGIYRQLNPQNSNNKSQSASVTKQQLGMSSTEVDKLTKSVGAFKNTMNSMDLDYREIDRTTRSLERMAEQLENINTELAGGEQGFFDKFNNNTPTAGDALRGASNTESEQFQRLNRTMEDILAVLMQSNDMNSRQLRAVRSLTGNLYSQ